MNFLTLITLQVLVMLAIMSAEPAEYDKKEHKLTCIQCEKEFIFVKEGIIGRLPGICSPQCRKDRRAARKNAAKRQKDENFDKSEEPYKDDDEEEDEPKDVKKDEKEDVKKDEKKDDDDPALSWEEPGESFENRLKTLKQQKEELDQKIALEKEKLIQKQKALKRKIDVMTAEVNTIDVKLTQLKSL